MNRDRVTPREAVRRASLLINLPTALLVAVPLVAYLLTVGGDLLFTRGGLLRLLAVGGTAFAAGWLWWSLAVPRWRLWAYERVPNLLELKRLAVLGKILWPEGSWFERTEIASRELRKHLRKLELAFDERMVRGVGFEEWDFPAQHGTDGSSGSDSARITGKNRWRVDPAEVQEWMSDLSVADLRLIVESEEGEFQPFSREASELELERRGEVDRLRAAAY